MAEYTCAHCNGTFEQGWSDEEALAEYAANFSEFERTGNKVVVCDDCYKKIMPGIQAFRMGEN